jgi:hypothetical protein
MIFGDISIPNYTRVANCQSGELEKWRIRRVANLLRGEFSTSELVVVN